MVSLFDPPKKRSRNTSRATHKRTHYKHDRRKPNRHKKRKKLADDFPGIIITSAMGGFF